MSKSKFVYVTYIRTTPASDWRPGSPWKHQSSDGSCGSR